MVAARALSTALCADGDCPSSRSELLSLFSELHGFSCHGSRYLLLPLSDSELAARSSWASRRNCFWVDVRQVPLARFPNDDDCQALSRMARFSEFLAASRKASGPACGEVPRIAAVPAALQLLARVDGQLPRAARGESAPSCLATAAPDTHGEHGMASDVQEGRGKADDDRRAHLRGHLHLQSQRSCVRRRPIA